MLWGKMETISQSSEGTQKEINITYETLFELLRVEKSRDDLQELHNSFFDDVLAYLREKQQILDESRVKEDIFSSTERDKVSTEMSNIKRILKELYERREKKIIHMALNKSRTNSNIIDTSKLMEIENNFFSHIVGTLDKFRSGIIVNILDFRQPFIKDDIPSNAAETTAGNDEGKKTEEKKDTKLVRFLHPIPKFIGKELEFYGPYEEEDMATLPTDIAEVLITKGRAEEMSEG